MPSQLPSELKYYVYLLIDPRNEEVFYVGKGHNDRALNHLASPGEQEKGERIRAIRAAGFEPRVDILTHGMDSDGEALRIEAAVIDACPRQQLTNRIRGWHTRNFGRMSLDQVQALYARRPIVVRDNLLLIRLRRNFVDGMAPHALYEATRRAWKVGEKRNQAEFACSVFDGVIIEVYAIAAWLPGGSTMHLPRADDAELENDLSQRWEFVGRLADERIRKRYRGMLVGQLFPTGAQNPIRYAFPNEH